MWRILLTLSGLCGWLLASSQAPVAAFVENRGQWPPQVLARAHVPGGTLFLEADAMTFVLAAPAPLVAGAPEPAHRPPERFHAYRVGFTGAQGGAFQGLWRQPHHENHFIGNDPAHWAARVPVHGGAMVHGVMPGVSLRLDGRQGLKYDIIVAPGSDPAGVELHFQGQDGLRLEEGRLVVHTSAGSVVEDAPVAFQEVHGRRVDVPCRFRLDGDRLGFELPEGYDPAHELVIDPVLNFATYSGSTSSNFGFTATYDGSGHLYGGGIVFGAGYPTTLGALGQDYNGGTIDMAISKFSLDGSSLLWSTYLGGSLNEAPHSMVVNANDELYVLGTTGSADFPVTPGCFDAVFDGGPTIPLTIGYGFGYSQGTDLVLCRLNADGSALLGSTFMGGSDNDGINNVATLVYNYGDTFRGEVVLDAMQRPLVATCTRSLDAAVTPGAAQTVFGGGEQDAYLFRMNAALTTLEWATYYGGTGDDAGYSVQLASNGSIYMAGGTSSTDLPMVGIPHAGSAAGDTDGYLVRIAPNGSAWTASTYVGTSEYDQCYFVQLDVDDEVYVVGQSTGPYPVTPGKYSNPGSAQFMHKFSGDLSTSRWSTVFGTGNGTVDIAPSAFLVSDCGQIYFSGWGGSVNAINSQATASTTNGLPVSPDAFQPTTTGSDFYLLVLEPDAVALNYATFLGGPSSAEHVDGGTSRFDKDGNIYQAVCGGCFGNSDFPTSPGAWSAENNASCNLAVVKFGLSQNLAVVGLDGPSYVCHPAPAQFLNLSIGGNGYIWDMGDGTVLQVDAPLHTFPGPGTYSVSLTLTDDSGCIPNDTAWISVEVVDPFDAAIAPVGPVCLGESVQLMASGGVAYAWFPPTGLSDTTVADPVATAEGPFTWYVAVTDSCGTDTVSISITPVEAQASVGPDVEICLGASVQLEASGGTSFQWEPPTGLDDATAATPMASPPETITYTVTVTTDEGCEATAEVLVEVTQGPPDPQLNDTLVCAGGSVQLQANGGLAYQWNAAPGITDLDLPTPMVSPPETMWYVVQVSNACGSVLDSVLVEVVRVIAQAWSDTTICPGDPVWLNAAGGSVYQWSPPDIVEDPGSASTLAYPREETVFTVLVADAYGCTDSEEVQVWMHPLPEVDAGPDRFIMAGDMTQLNATGAGAFGWEPPVGLSCLDCPDPIAMPETSTTYTVTLTDVNGCRAVDLVTVYLEGNLFVPNTFTPNGDGMNEVFRAIATEVGTFRMDIFNRWGELIHTVNDHRLGWDGTYGGVPSPIDTYVWRIDISDLQGNKRTLYGHVNLVR